MRAEAGAGGGGLSPEPPEGTGPHVDFRHLTQNQEKGCCSEPQSSTVGTRLWGLLPLWTPPSIVLGAGERRPRPACPNGPWAPCPVPSWKRDPALVLPFPLGPSLVSQLSPASTAGAGGTWTPPGPRLALAASGYVGSVCPEVGSQACIPRSEGSSWDGKESGGDGRASPHILPSSEPRAPRRGPWGAPGRRTSSAAGRGRGTCPGSVTQPPAPTPTVAARPPAVHLPPQPCPRPTNLQGWRQGLSCL